MISNDLQQIKEVPAKRKRVSVSDADLIGRRFGNRVVLEITRDARGYPACLCLCNKCRTKSVITRSRLLAGKANGCRKCQITKHGDTKNYSATPEYMAWRSMIQRCTNPKNPKYQEYGGRGITVCRRWQESYENFLTDMGRRPSLEHSLDRIDVNGNYEPENCRWATQEEQQNNRRCSQKIAFEGRTQGIYQWAKESGINVDTLRNRIESGWAVDQALTQVPQKRLKSPDQMHCPHGHLYAPENTYVDAKGSLRCRECRRKESREWYRRKREAARLNVTATPPDA